MLRPRDIRTITCGPVFYDPLPSLPRGKICFILVGGPMEYVDRRGEHSCISGELPPGGAAAGQAESVARMSAMVDGEPWMQAAAGAGQAILASLARAGEASGLYGHLVSYVTSPFRAAVKTLTGSPPKKVAEDAWGLAPVGNSRWSYQRDAGHFIFNASAGFTLVAVETAPTVCIWGWADRSDGCLQAFLDTIAVRASDPVFAILPDVPSCRDFARRYVRSQLMVKADRALIGPMPPQGTPASVSGRSRRGRRPARRTRPSRRGHRFRCLGRCRPAAAPRCQRAAALTVPGRRPGTSHHTNSEEPS